MKFRHSFLLFIICGVVACNLVYAAPFKYKPVKNSVSAIDYTGKLSDREGRPLAAIKMQLSSGELTVTTSKTGTFAFSANPGDTLTINNAGYLPLRLILPENPLLTLVLETDMNLISTESLKPVELIYTTSPSNVTSASNDAVYSRDILKSPVTSFRNALTGRLAGLYTAQGSGLPGADGSSLSLRGQAPVIIIDGVVANLTTFDLEEIESITVLKDAVGTAMLGIRGSGGAVVVTTKKGKAGKQQLSFTAQTASQKPIGVPKTLRSYDYARLYNEALVNDGLPVLYSDADLQGYQNQSDPYKYPDVDWRNQVLENSSRFNKYTLSATGGNKFARYFVSLEHINQSGFLKTADSNSYNTNNSFKAYLIRTNVDVSVTEKLTGGIYLLGRILNANEPGATTGSILSNLLGTPSNAYPVFNANGSLGGSQQFQNNILGQTVASGYRQNYKRDMLVNLYLRRTFDEITKGLYLQAKVAYYASLSEDINRSKSFAVFQQSSTGTYSQFGTNGIQANGSGIDYQGRADYLELKLGYDRIFGNKHGINALLLINRDNAVNGSELPYTISGTSGKLSYNFKGKYFAEAVFGYNGSNRYPPEGNTKRGFFPAIGVGWNIEQEDFMKSNAVVSHLKLYGSYGKTGADDPGYFTYVQRFFDASTTFFGTGPTGNTSISQLVFANPNISWEKANKLNVGIDGGFFNNRLGFTLEYYKNKFYDLLQQRGRNSSLIGNTYPNENIGQNRYSGWEAQVSWSEAKSSFQYFVAANASVQKSEVLFIDEVYTPYDWMKRTGQTVGRRFGYIAEGLFQSQAEINSSATTVGYTPQPGDIKYKDLNNDKVIDQFDVAPIGTDKPFIFYGVNLGASWKGFDFSALVQGVHNRDTYLGGASNWAFQGGGFGQAYEDNLNRWTPANATNATYPRLNIGTNTNNQATSSYWIVSGNYIRLKNVEVGYSLPNAIISKAKLQAARLFVNGFNLATSSSSRLGGRDPEVTSAFSYPNQKLINLGINIKF